jgi:NDP-sugar pyrophosphorylase family protein
MSTDNAAPIAVVGFSSATSPLEPAWPSTHRALLPVAGKPLIVHLVEQLTRSGIRHLRIAGSIQQYAVRQRLRNGQEWGITIRYSDLHDADLRMQTLLEHGQCLYLCGDNLHIGDFSRISPAANPHVADPMEGNESSAYWRLSSAGPARYSIRVATQKPYTRNPLLTVRSYHDANIAVAAGRTSLLVPGRTAKSGVAIDWDSYLAPDIVLGDGITIGKHCRLDRRVRLHTQCVLSNGVIVGRDTQLHNVSVLPNTYVGIGTRLRDAVVTPLGLFDLDGKFWPTRDRSVVGRARSNAEQRTGIPSEKLSVLEMDPCATA